MNWKGSVGMGVLRLNLSRWERLRRRLPPYLIPGIPLFLPRVSSVVIAADFPIARRILFQEFDALQPFCAFPEIKMRHHEAHRAAMLRVQRFTRPGMRQQSVF